MKLYQKLNEVTRQRQGKQFNCTQDNSFSRERKKLSFTRLVSGESSVSGVTLRASPLRRCLLHRRCGCKFHTFLSLPLPATERQSQVTLGERKQFQSVGRGAILHIFLSFLIESLYVIGPEVLRELGGLFQRVAGKMEVCENVSRVGYRDHVPLFTTAGLF